MAELEKEDGVAALAFRFPILTAARTGEVIGADGLRSTWRPRSGRYRGRMKGGQEHRVPLTDAALAVLRQASKLRPSEADGPVFPAARAARGQQDCPTWRC